MADTPSPRSGEPRLISCPFCTIRIPDDVSVCPFCLRSVFRDKVQPPPQDDRRRPVLSGRFPALDRCWEEYGKWLKIAAPVLAAVLVLWIAYGRWMSLKVEVSSDGRFAVEASREKRGRNILLKGKLTNLGEDVPDLSLQSIGVIAEFRYRDGKTDRRRFFPKSLYRGEGALMRGETGSFEIEVPKGVAAVSLRGEIVDLGEDRTFIPAGRGIPRAPEQKTR